MRLATANAAVYLQGAINHPIREALDDFTFDYFDEGLIYSNSKEEDSGHVERIIEAGEM
jgi:hypothetical protein